MRHIRWSARAQADLAEIDEFYRSIGSDLADRLVREAVAAARWLCEHPMLGQTTSRKGLRKWRVGRLPYVLLYRLSPGDLRIVRVVHFARDWQRFV